MKPEAISDVVREVMDSFVEAGVLEEVICDLRYHIKDLILSSEIQKKLETFDPGKALISAVLLTLQSESIQKILAQAMADGFDQKDVIQALADELHSCMIVDGQHEQYWADQNLENAIAETLILDDISAISFEQVVFETVSKAVSNAFQTG